MQTLIARTPVTAADAGVLRPTFGVDFPAFGAKGADNKKMPASIPGTFLDLFTPETRAKKRDKYAFTLKAFTQAFGRALLRDITGAMLPDDKKADLVATEFFNDEELRKYYATTMPALAKLVRVQRQGNGWLLSLPILTINLNNMITRCMKEYTDETPSYVAAQFNRIATYVLPTLKTLGWRFDSTAVNFDMPLNRVGSSFHGEFLQANQFLAKYAKKFNVEGKQKLPIIRTRNGDAATSLTEVPLGEQETLGAFVSGAMDAIFVARVDVFLPDEETSYYFQTPPEDVKPTNVLDFMYRWYKYAFTTKTELPTFTHPISSPAKKNVAFVPRPRTNNLGLVLTSRNTLMYVPENVDSLQEFEKNYTDSTQTEDGYYTVASKPSEELINAVTHKLLFVDWVGNKIMYTGETPNILILDLENTYKPTAASIIKRLMGELNYTMVSSFIGSMSNGNRKVFGKEDTLSSFASSVEIGNMADILYSINRIAAQNFLRGFSASMPIEQYATAVISFMFDIHQGENKSYNVEVIPEAFNVYPVKAKDVVDSSQNPLYLPIARWLKETHDAVMKDPLHYINNCGASPATTLDRLGSLITWNQAVHFETIRNEDFQEREVYFTQDDLDPNYVPAFKNSEGVKSLLPHQAKVLNANRKIPKFSIIAVAAGGGKTIITIEDIMRAIEEGVVKRPLVDCPAYLMKDYVAEINYVSQGKTNVVVFDTAVFNSYSKTPETASTGVRDYTKLKALVDNAPPNTIFVTGYDVYARSGNQISVYGGELVYSNSHIEFMRSCHFDGVWLDESHFLKSAGANRAIATETLIAEIPYKRLLTGTIAPNSLVDLVRQVGYFNPDILGSEADFRQRYSEDGSDSGTFVAKQGAEYQIYRELKNQVVFQNVQRKEWAALLPPMVEYFVPAYLTPNQKKVYDVLLGELVDKMSADAEVKTLLKEEEENDLEAADDIEYVFQNYEENLSAIESFLASPLSTPMSEEMLVNPEDKISPKGKEVIEIIQTHLANSQKYPGKIIVFCNTYASVEGIFREFPPEVQALTVRYHADTKTEDEAEFKTNPKKRIIIGISQSMETGLNLQIADTLIRVDNVWSPGRFEQGLARVNRPNLKDAGGDPRMKTGIHMYYIMVDRTIDILKVARLTSKTVQIAKFYNAGTPDYKYYEGIGLDANGTPLEPIRVSMENLRAGLTYAHDLEPYKTAYAEYRSAESKVFEKYREDHPELTKVNVKHTGLLKGSKLLTRIPYTPGMSIFAADQLGLVPYPTYKRQFIEKYGEEKWDPINLPVHTEYGEGLLTGVKASYIGVDLYAGGNVNLQPSVIFVITKKLTSTKEIRQTIADIVGLESVEIKLESFRLEQRKARKENQERKLQERELERQMRIAERQKRKDEKLQPLQVVKEDKRRKQDNVEDMLAPADDEDNNVINLYLSLTNSMLSLATSGDDPDANYRELKAYGFQLIRPYWYIELKQAAVMNAFIDKLDVLSQKGTIVIQDKYFYLLEDIYNEFKQGRSKLLQVSNKTQTDIGHFLLDRRRKITNPLEIRPMPMIVDGKLYICLDTATHNPAILQKVKRIQVPGVKWDLQDDALIAFFTKRSEVMQTIKEMKADGFTIENEAELKETYNQLKVRGVK